MTEQHLRSSESRRVSPQLQCEFEALGDRQQSLHSERSRAALQVTADHTATAPTERCVQLSWK